MRFYKKQFQWNLFKKLFIVPVCLEIVYRALVCRILDPKLEHPSFFTFFSGNLYAFSHCVNYFNFREKYGNSFALKTVGIQVGYNLVFGLYISHIFSRSSTLISTLVLQVYANFMGYPEYFEVLKGNMHDDRIRSNFSSYIRNYFVLSMRRCWLLQLLSFSLTVLPRKCFLFIIFIMHIRNRI